MGEHGELLEALVQIELKIQVASALNLRILSTLSMTDMWQFHFEFNICLSELKVIKYRSFQGDPKVTMPDLESLMNMFNMKQERIPPCLQPHLILNGLEEIPFETMIAEEFRYQSNPRFPAYRPSKSNFWHRSELFKSPKKSPGLSNANRFAICHHFLAIIA
ncbi:hypothetical protein BpHYR1_034689 [Brachionus plicatilis]|uniref:Uncharacterized protein n=1 Tax=Brachionus plicatilis TaxID=10195 RepID=A0A3M7SH99_BRAPC|nr:hypothetical protein BpHYR1_034689 [Brachionus plicatilis]